ncbi:hypothetical protein IVG45_14920 [Methylomonas sp. LL1]|uniref:hypothetical protein n=1 Tax=Methylomonas sp. LL1 TaxID=2785785 RepID=UPI0018C391D9|nr:hypothetical protein [Methylomonas sp. LL1]QPK62144.1 hypothetical protein IVG45_14920 [Methylomonas sp. LL1]
MSFHKDSLHANPLGEIATVKFDEFVVNVFPNIISAIGLLAESFSVHRQRFLIAGFIGAEIWFQYFISLR